ncbi:TadE/TadG family type IV pilus assembly protein [Streptomyces sp. NPDC127049]|uniref:TadE/TadG family type IV pilus assembly protein n=1 Tax=unclassified Streptomyces TaxID=2593676 RepID=UPI00364C85E2
MDQQRARGDRGQVAVEFTGMVPVILLTLALLWQVVLVGYTYILAGNAADEAARAAAVGGDCDGAARRHLDGAWAGATVDCGGAPSGGMVTVTVTVPVPVLFPGLGSFDGVPATAGAIDERPVTTP